MCVIIAKNPDATIPFEKFDSACHVNDDGYGISLIDRGKIETIKGYDAKGNDPEKIYKIINDNNKLPMFIHLRFRTAGDRSVDACHPFQTLEHASDGIDMQFMHNGTLYEFDKKDKMPDSYHFNMEVVRPLVQRLEKYHGGYDKVLEDPLLASILKQYAGSSSKFVLFDENGKFVIINKSSGKEFDGWWASNDYSFNRTHRTGGASNFTYRGPYGTWEDGDYPRYGTHSRGATSGSTTSTPPSLPKPEEKKTSVYQIQTPTGSSATSSPKTDDSASSGASGGSAISDGVKEDAERIGHIIREANVSSIPPVIAPPHTRETFVELSGLTTLEEACILDQESIEEIVEQYPELATTLIMDLLYELYIKRHTKAVG